MACARGRAPGAEQKQVAESGAALHEFIYALHHPPLSLLCSYPAPPPPPDSPLNVALRCLPCLLLSSSRFPCKQTNKQQQEYRLQKRPVLFVVLFLFDKLKARRSKLPCLSEALDLMQSTVSLPLKLIELRAVAPADDDRLNPHAPQWCSFSLCRGS